MDDPRKGADLRHEGSGTQLRSDSDGSATAGGSDRVASFRRVQSERRWVECVLTCTGWPSVHVY